MKILTTLLLTLGLCALSLPAFAGPSCDANADESLNVLDVVAIVGAVLGTNGDVTCAGPGCEECADITSDNAEIADQAYADGAASVDITSDNAASFDEGVASVDITSAIQTGCAQGGGSWGPVETCVQVTSGDGESTTETCTIQQGCTPVVIACDWDAGQLYNGEECVAGITGGMLAVEPAPWCAEEAAMGFFIDPDGLCSSTSNCEAIAKAIENIDQTVSDLMMFSQGNWFSGDGQGISSSQFFLQDLGVTLNCENVCPSINPADVCGVCGGPGIPEGDCDCDGHVLDACGVCGGSSTIPFTTADRCAGNYYNCTADGLEYAKYNDVEDKCNSCAFACAGYCDEQTPTAPGVDGCPCNDAFPDDGCGVCGGPGLAADGCCPQTPLGCTGVCGGPYFDCSDVCGGDDTSCEGCDGVQNSGKTIDICGVCGGAGNTCVEGCKYQHLLDYVALDDCMESPTCCELLNGDVKKSHSWSSWGVDTWDVYCNYFSDSMYYSTIAYWVEGLSVGWYSAPMCNQDECWSCPDATYGACTYLCD